MIEYVATDHYTGHHTTEQLVSDRAKVHKPKQKSKPDGPGGLPYIFCLHIGKPYMVTTNTDVLDGLVNGAIGTLRYID